MSEAACMSQLQHDSLVPRPSHVQFFDHLQYATQTLPPLFLHTASDQKLDIVTWGRPGTTLAMAWE